MKLFQSRARVRVAIILSVVTLLLTGAVYAVAASAPATRGSRSGEPTASVVASHSSRFYGISPAGALPVFDLRDGAAVALVANEQATCLVRTKGSQSAEDCYQTTSVNEGRAISVLDECGASGANLMEITGVAPAGIAVARLIWSDGRTEDVGVTRGAFKFEDTNPAPGAPYPVGVDWIQSGREAGHGTFPVEGDQFCLPAS